MKKTANACLIFILVVISVFFAGCSDGSEETHGEMLTSSDKQIVINEVMSSNSIFFPAADGRCYDWVELRNLSGTAYDLSKCYLTDDEQDPFKFKLNNVTVSPLGYSVIYLSGLNKTDESGGVHANFKLSSAGETIYLNDSNGVIISSLSVPESTQNVSFGFPADAENFSDDYCVWFAAPTPNGQNDDEYSRTLSDLNYHSNEVIINEYMIDNSLTIYDADGDYADWIELYNPSSVDADLTGYMLSDDPNATGIWSFPEKTIIPAEGYLLVFCSGKDIVDGHGNLHTNFSLSTEDLVISLNSYQGVTVSQMEIYDLPENISCGRIPDSEEIKLFSRSTPGQPNTTSYFELNSRPTPDINDGVLISETLSVSSASSDYTSDYIEIFNSLNQEIQLKGYTLAQTIGETAFTFPEVTLAPGGYLLVWCDGTLNDKNVSNLHAPIKLNIGGERLYLIDSSGKIVDYMNTGKQSYGVSSGRFKNDTSVRYYFTEPTPGTENNSAKYVSYAPKPQFSQYGGYVPEDTEVFISVPQDCVVRYTTNGINPDENSAIYDPSSPIRITRTVVLKAVAYQEGCLPSDTISATYLIEEPHSLPVVSLSGSGLINSDSGILVSNEHYNEIRSVHFEYYDERGVIGTEFNAGAKIFGNTSRQERLKGLRLKINEQYGSTEITYPFFKDSVSGVNTFKDLLLRPSGQDQVTAIVRDELVPSIIRGQVDVDYMEVCPCVLYVNGEYWGIYYIRDRLDEDYLISKYGYEKGTTDLIKSQRYVQAGSVTEYRKLEAFARNNDLTIKENYEYMKSVIDFESLCDFWIVETYFANTDSENIRCYRTENGKWRWMVYDMDWSMWPKYAYTNFIWGHCIDPDGHGVFESDNSIIRELLKNDEFRDIFISRYCYHLNNTFTPDRCIAVLDQLSGSIRSEISRNYDRWNRPAPNTWEKNIEFLRGFLANKPQKAKEQLMSTFNLSEKEMEKYMRENH